MTYRIGIDGGGMKTECILVDPHGNIAARHSAPGSNPSLIGPGHARTVLVQALEALLTQPEIENREPTIAVTCLYMAGSTAYWEEVAAGLSGFGRVIAAPDSIPVLELATGDNPGLVLHAGTGSFVAARAPDGSIHYAGGLGWRFSDGGSGYDLGRRAIARGLLELQGWAEHTDLAGALIRHTGLTDCSANSRFFYTGTDAGSKIAAFAPRVIDLAEHGCTAAQQIIADSVADLAALVPIMLQRLFSRATIDSPARCAISGALLNRLPCLHVLRALAAAQAWPVDLHSMLDPPIEGVRRLLVKTS